MTVDDASPEKSVAGLSLRDGARQLIRIMPVATQRSIRLAMVFSFLLAGIEFLAIFILYPVFGFLSQPTSDTFSLPFVGMEISRSSARLLAVVALTSLILRSLLTLVYRRWWLRVTALAELQLSSHLLRNYAFAPYKFHLQSLSSDLMARAVADVSIACQSGLVGLVGSVSSFMLVCGLSLALVVASPITGVAVLLFGGALGGLYVRFMRSRTIRYTAELQRHISRTYRDVSVLLTGIREITVFGQRERYLERTAESRRSMVLANSRIALLQDIPRAVLEVALYATVLVALTILLSMANPDSVLPLVALYVVAGLRIIPSLIQLLGNLSSLRTGTQITVKLVDEIGVIEAAKPVESDASGEPFSSGGDLDLAGVGFRYTDDGPEVLSDVSIVVPFGEFLGIVGESGAGKTTLTGVILGLLDVTSGALSYGGRPIRGADPAWFERVAVVPQNVFLTDDSLRDNVLAGADRDDEMVDRVVELSGLGPLVARLPQGLDTPLLEGGARFSEGQRQRVGLARALYRNPEVLVLDEPTSALDAETERHVIESITRLKGSMTVIAVAHRTHTLVDADVVMQLDDGRVVAVGPPGEVLDIGPEIARE
jgi:ABC-type multidrug transport system fused ATPase/permease subunit